MVTKTLEQFGDRIGNSANAFWNIYLEHFLHTNPMMEGRHTFPGKLTLVGTLPWLMIYNIGYDM